MRYLKGSLLIFFLGWASLAQADVPRVINYQGHLTDSNGVALTGHHSIIFRLYDGSGSPVGTPVQWSENQSITPNNGYFSTTLGAIMTFSSVGATFTIPYFLGIQVDADPEMQPKIALNAVPYSMQVPDGSIMNNKLVAGAVGTTTIANGAVTQANMAANSVGTNQILDNNVTASKISSLPANCVGTNQILDNNVTASKISGLPANCVGSSQTVSGAIDTQAKATWAPTVNGGITYPKIAFGSATTVTPSGTAMVSLSGYGFTNPAGPAIVCTAVPGNNTRSIMIASQSNTQFVAYVRDDTNNGNFNVAFNWVAIGQ